MIDCQLGKDNVGEKKEKFNRKVFFLSLPSALNIDDNCTRQNSFDLLIAIDSSQFQVLGQWGRSKKRGGGHERDSGEKMRRAAHSLIVPTDQESLEQAKARLRLTAID